MITGQEVAALRTRLGLTKTELAEFLRVDTRSITNWEVDGMYPKGSAAAILIGLRESLDRAKSDFDRAFVIHTVRRSIEMGGLSYMLVIMFDMLMEVRNGNR